MIRLTCGLASGSPGIWATPHGRKRYLAASEALIRRRQPDWTESQVQAALKELASQDLRLHAQQGAHSLEDRLKGFPLFCLTAHRDEILSWTHYADQHRGVCIHFNCRRESNFPFAHARRVMYSPDRPVFEIPRLPRDSLSVVDRAALTKHRGWHYEDEFGLLSAPGNNRAS
jgi:hypothetical protein